MAKEQGQDGSIYHRKSDGRYVGCMTLPNGKRKYFYGKTKQEVQERLQREQKQLATEKEQD